MTDPRLRLDAKTTTLVVIDMQEKLLHSIPESEGLIRATVRLLRTARELGLEVIATTQYEKGLGPVVEAVAVELGPTAFRFEKTAFSCFDEPGFAQLLGPGQVLLMAGIEAHICVAGTVFGALRAGHPVEVAVDAVSSRLARDAEVGFARMERAGALATTSEMVAYELLRDSRGPAFKAILPLFKSK